ncbi:MAG: carbamoyl-phosphate synthase large subunit [Chlorobi bacterium]|nr:carbamoyl-phosphate synthase large subunit [Chlorobiota bacterium]
MPRDKSIKSVFIIGSGPIIIGQACEFDYSGSQAIRSLKEEGIEVILLNNNPATIMTDPSMADHVYMMPMTVESIEYILQEHKVDAVLPTMGGQTALNLCREAWEAGIWDKYGVRIIGADMEAIETTEDREKFRNLLIDINVPVPPAQYARTVFEGVSFAERVGYPVVIRPSYTLGGSGAAFVHNREELEEKLQRALEISPIHTALVEKALVGWKEFELEVMRDKADNFIVICTIENMDPMGIHTGDSITVAPAMTLPDTAFQKMRDLAHKMLNALGSFAGGCNVQFAMDPRTEQIVAIEINPRVSRSSALASKATGYPIAKIAAKLAIGYRLDELKNPVTKKTSAFFEPTLDYVIVKIPRWDFKKFPGADDRLGMQMKSVGEVMALGRTFSEALQKAARSLEIGVDGVVPLEDNLSDEELELKLKFPSWDRLFAIRTAFDRGWSIDRVHKLTYIDPWFLNEIKKISDLHKFYSGKNIDDLTQEDWDRLKEAGFGDKTLAQIFNVPEAEIRKRRKAISYKVVDTCAAEFPSDTPYFYGTYDVENENWEFTNGKPTAIILGSGPNRIGQGIEFDYCCVHGIWALQDVGYNAIMVNCNPETVSTDYDISDKLYFEPLEEEHVFNVLEHEKPEGIIVQLGGQTALKLAKSIHDAGYKILGTSFESINRAEDRGEFSKLLEELNIPYPPYGVAYSPDEAVKVARQIGFPVLVRPSYVLGGQRMRIIITEEELKQWTEIIFKEFPNNSLLIDKFLPEGKEVDVDAISDGEDVHIMGILEHLEPAGVHSGDSRAVLPPFSISEEDLATIEAYTYRIAKALNVKGFINIQFVIHNHTVYVIEANPRASRTVPFIAKAYGIPYVNIAVKIMTGKNKLKDFKFEKHLDGYAIKEPVFPWDKFPEVKPELGPEMRSTGEIIHFVKSTEDPYFKKILKEARGIYLVGK